MFSVTDQQNEIWMLKCNLKKIENDLAVQYSAIPELNVEQNKTYKKTNEVLLKVRSLNMKIENLELKHDGLIAKKVQLQLKCRELSEDLDTARKNRDQLSVFLKQEETEIELKIRQHEDTLQEKAERFRKTRGYYDEAEIDEEVDCMNSEIAKLQDELAEKQNITEELKAQAESIRPQVPEDLLIICGRPELDERIKALVAKFEVLSAKY